MISNRRAYLHSLAMAVLYRCKACGNKTRFDVTETVRRTRFHHYTLGGDLTVEDEDVLESSVESVRCRWCDRTDAIEVVEASASAPGLE